MAVLNSKIKIAFNVAFSITFPIPTLSIQNHHWLMEIKHYCNYICSFQMTTCWPSLLLSLFCLSKKFFSLRRCDSVLVKLQTCSWMASKCRFNHKRLNNRTNIDWKMRSHVCGELAKSWKPDLEKERVERKEKEGGGWEHKTGGRHSSVSYISWLNESVQKSELSDQWNRQTWPGKLELRGITRTKW